MTLEDYHYVAIAYPSHSKIKGHIDPTDILLSKVYQTIIAHYHGYNDLAGFSFGALTDRAAPALKTGVK